jgi:hypothetical protein
MADVVQRGRRFGGKLAALARPNLGKWHRRLAKTITSATGQKRNFKLGPQTISNSSRASLLLKNVAPIPDSMVHRA